MWPMEHNPCWTQFKLLVLSSTFLIFYHFLFAYISVDYCCRLFQELLSIVLASSGSLRISHKRGMDQAKELVCDDITECE